jgi:hypothetical protein
MNYQITQETRQRYPDIAISPRIWPMRRIAHGSFNEQSSDADVELVTKTASRIRLQKGAKRDKGDKGAKRAKGAKGTKQTASTQPITESIPSNDDNEFWFQDDHDQFMSLD